MLIGINGQRLLTAEPAGPEIYTANIVQALAKIDNDNNYTVYFDREPSEAQWANLSAGNPNFTYKVVPKIISWTQGGLMLELLRNPVDVFFTAVHTLPIIRRRSVKIVAMVHGLEYRFNKQDSILKKLLVSKPEWYVSKYSDVLIVPSGFTKEAILQKDWGVSENKIKIIYEGVSSEFYQRPESEIQSIKEKYDLAGKDYMLFVSTIQPRKNLPHLIEAFSRSVKLSGKDVHLVVVGKKGWDYEESLEAPKKYEVEDKVHFLGRVPSEDLPMLYSGTSAFVSTSLEEGFGLPLLEAMSCRVPCIVSDIPAFRESGGDTVWYTDPTDVTDTADRLNSFYNGEYNDMLIDKAYLRSREYTWEKSAEKTLSEFKK
jgi:glycosyltransferase involved in cell wall biosynthesis